MREPRSFIGKFASLSQSILIVTLLVLVIYLFYFGSRNLNLVSLLWQFIFITLLTDFLYLALHLFRKPVSHNNLSFDPTKLTIVIACYNGEDIISETIENALVQVPRNQIIVVSDASTDRTSKVACSYGVRVYTNVINMNKAFSVSSIMRYVETPYVLVLDDDTLIGKTLIPTSLLDEGYDGVAFNVMPVEQDTIVNKLQRFEYRKSMFFGKSLRGDKGAVGNVSGAIGLFRTEDLKFQARRHSGQFGGEDQQRTALAQIYGGGRGVTYTDSLVETKTPNSLKALFRQRAFRWNLSLPELFSVYWRVLMGTKHHYLLKVEKAYQIFLYSTDPFRALLIWIPLFYPWRLSLLYFFYLFMSLSVWVRLECKDPLWVVLVFPFYRQAEILCRMIAHFYWFKIKYTYIFRKRFHRYVTQRKVVPEYAVVAIFISIIWVVSVIELAPRAASLQASIYPKKYIPQPVSTNFQEVKKYVDQYGTSPTTVSSAQP